jgi:hypothetical protein
MMNHLLCKALHNRWLMSCVRCFIFKPLSVCKVPISCCWIVLGGTTRVCLLITAWAIATASFLSFFCPSTKALTRRGEMIWTVWPNDESVRCQYWLPAQASIPIKLPSLTSFSKAYFPSHLMHANASPFLPDLTRGSKAV